MKIFLFTLLSIVFLLSFWGLSFFLWNNINFLGKLLFVLGDIYWIFYVFRVLNSYVRVNRENDILTVKKLFSKKTFNLQNLKHWNESQNVYRVRNRKLNLQFENERIKLIDTYDENVGNLYHYLRTHHNEKGN